MVGVAVGIHLYIESMGIEVTTTNFISVMLPVVGVFVSTLVGLATVLIYPIVGLMFTGDTEDEH